MGGGSKKDGAVASVTVDEIIGLLGSAVTEVHGRRDRSASRPIRIDDTRPRESGFSFLSSALPTATDLLRRTRAEIVFCLPSVAEAADAAVLSRTSLIAVDNPRLAFIRLVRDRFTPSRQSGVEAGAVISPRATISETAWVGSQATIGACEIEPDCVIHPRAVLYDNVRLERGVIVHSGAVIGADGFGYERNEAGAYERFPHIGGVLVGDGVEIGANACVDRAALGDTVIGRGTKIDNLVYVAHNVVVGEDCILVAGTTLCGSSTVGDGAWLGPGSVIRDKIRVGHGATVGAGAVVVKDVEPGATVAGVPARRIPNATPVR